METPKTSENFTRVALGLKALTICPENDHKHHNSCIMTSNLMSPPSSPSFSHMGDYIGMESCVDLKSDEDDVNVTTKGDEASKAFRSQRYQCKRDQRWAMKKREIPPPITLLARTENLPSHMPFVLKRYYTSDGRLILREERVRHHEYFKVHRSNGHLTLQLVPLDHDDIWVPPLADLEYQYDEQCKQEQVVEAELETGDSGEKNEFVDKNDNVDKDTGHTAETVEKYDCFESSPENESVGIGCNGGPNKCLNYSSVIMSSSCFLGMPVTAIKSVRT
ncbi:hypothetical protein ACOSP7_010030 [Xanthoceras sorbifolium]|uniref:FAF domain-containing protein n=1 Tax=Xanthoceras sorbifolium TaxID=99658 RepID=A0ABQ8HTU1_9ROSI|nr:hypothetical protein JRO89_XS07G0152900 [Xanthoceras sorbifolium]